MKKVTIAAGQIDELDDVFDGCEALSSIRLHEPVPAILFEDWAAKCAAGCELEVPSESVEVYKEAPLWKNFAVIKALDTDGVERITCSGFKVSSLKGALLITGDDKVSITDMGGKTVYRGPSGTVQLPSGLYIVTVGTQHYKVFSR